MINLRLIRQQYKPAFQISCMLDICDFNVCTDLFGVGHITYTNHENSNNDGQHIMLYPAEI